MERPRAFEAVMMRARQRSSALMRLAFWDLVEEV